MGVASRNTIQKFNNQENKDNFEITHFLVNFPLSGHYYTNTELRLHSLAGERINSLSRRQPVFIVPANKTGVSF